MAWVLRIRAAGDRLDLHPLLRREALNRNIPAADKKLGLSYVALISHLDTSATLSPVKCPIRISYPVETLNRTTLSLTTTCKVNGKSRNVAYIFQESTTVS